MHKGKRPTSGVARPVSATRKGAGHMSSAVSATDYASDVASPLKLAQTPSPSALRSRHPALGDYTELRDVIRASSRPSSAVKRAIHHNACSPGSRPASAKKTAAPPPQWTTFKTDPRVVDGQSPVTATAPKPQHRRGSVAKQQHQPSSPPAEASDYVLDDFSDDDATLDPKDVAALRAVQLRGITPTLNALSCAQQLDWEARRQTLAGTNTIFDKHGPASSATTASAPRRDAHSVLHRRVDIVQSRLASRLREVVATDQRQVRAAMHREAKSGVEVSQGRQMKWLNMIALVVPINFFADAVRHSRANRVIETVFCVHIMHHFRRQAALRVRRDFERRCREALEPVSVALVGQAIPRMAHVLRTLPDVISNRILFDALTPPDPSAYKDDGTHPENDQCPFRPICFRKGEYAFFSEQIKSKKQLAAEGNGQPPSSQGSRLLSTNAFIIVSGSIHVTFKLRKSDKSPSVGPLKRTAPLGDDGAAGDRYRERHGPGSIVALERLLGSHGRPHVAVCETDVVGYAVNALELNARLYELDTAFDKLTAGRPVDPDDNDDDDDNENNSRRQPQNGGRHSAAGAAGASALAAREDPDVLAGIKTHGALASIVQARRLYALASVPPTAEFLKASSPHLEMWSARGLRDLAARMAPLSLQRRTVLPSDTPALLTVIESQRYNHNLNHGDATVERKLPVWAASGPETADDLRGPTRTAKKRQSAQGPGRRHRERGGSGGGGVGDVQDTIVYFVVHGTVGRLAGVDGGHVASKPGNATATIASSSPHTNAGAGAHGGATQFKGGAAVGLSEVIHNRPLPRLVALGHVDVWALRQVDFIDALAHEDPAALVPAFVGI